MDTTLSEIKEALDNRVKKKVSLADFIIITIVAANIRIIFVYFQLWKSVC